MKQTEARFRQLVLACALAVTGLSSHASGEAVPAQHTVKRDTILLTVNGQPVRRALFDGLVKARTEQTNPYDEPEENAASHMAVPIDKKAVLEDLINMEVLAQKAREEGIHLRPDFVIDAELQYKTLLQQELVRKIIAELRIDPAEIAARYEAQKPERSYRISHILLNSEQDAETVICELNKGAQFQTLAHKRTLDANTKKDGMLGWMMASQLEQSFVSALEPMKPGTYSQKPVHTQYGWHVVRLHDARDLPKPPLSTAKTWLRQEILYEKVKARVEEIRRAAKVEVPSSLQATKTGSE